MSRRKTKVPAPPVIPIVVEERSREERWCEAGRQLNAVNPEKLDKLVAAAELYLATYERESDLHLRARLVESNGAPWTFAIKWRSN